MFMNLKSLVTFCALKKKVTTRVMLASWVLVQKSASCIIICPIRMLKKKKNTYHKSKKQVTQLSFYDVLEQYAYGMQV